MTLDQYLSRSKRGAARSLASALGVSEITVHRWRRGKQMPPHSMIQKIEVETCGGVRPADWYTSQESAE